MAWLQDIWGRFKAVVVEPLDLAHGARRRWPVVLVRLALQIGRQWIRDRCPQKAATLTFQTILSLVPLLAVSFAVLHALKLLQARSAIADFVSRHILPVAGEEIIDRLLAFAANVRTGALGPLGVLATIGLAFLLFYSVESAYNDIWRVGQRRTLIGKFTVFYPVATLAPMLIGLTLYYTARFWRAGGTIGFIAPLGSTFTAFLLLNKLLPKAGVRWRAAAAGALVSALAFEIAKRFFQLYVVHVAARSFQSTYGALGVIPIFLLWVYYTWLVVLFGVEVSYTAQNLQRLEEAELTQLKARERTDDLWRRVNGSIAARLLMVVARNFAEGRKALPKAQLLRMFQLPDEVLDAIFAELKANDLAIEVHGEISGFLPARPLDEISVQEVLELFNGDDPGPADALGRLQHRLRASRDEVLGELTFADLLAGGDAVASTVGAGEARSPAEGDE